MKKIAFFTLGCKVNQIETEQLKEEFLKKKYLIVDFSDRADIYIINTCSVTHTSESKSRSMLRRAVRRNPDAVIVAVGCMAQVSTQQLAQISGINLIIGNGDKNNITPIVDDYVSRGKTALEIYSRAIDKNEKPSEVLYSKKHQRTRAFVKIQDGCESYCSYCIVPFARGPIRSKRPENIINEIRQLLNLGYREIVLSGIHTGFYGSDLEGWNFTRLLQYILNEVKGDFRLRLGSIEPLELRDSLLDIISNEERVCRHFHIPLQSGSDRILKSMGRRYDSGYYRNLLEKIYTRIPDVALTTDVMVGYPTENAEDFNDTYQLLKSSAVMDLHVFKYSLRPGTRAAEMFPQVEEKDKQYRSEILIELAHNKKNDFIKKITGGTFRLLVERKLGEDLYMGITDNYLEVVFSTNKYLDYDFIDIVINGVFNGQVSGQLCI